MSSRWKALFHDQRLASLCMIGLAATGGGCCDRRTAGVRRSEVARRPPTCAAADLVLSRFPLAGVNGRDWMINNYVDLDATSPGRLDYADRTGDRARTYDGHRG